MAHVPSLAPAMVPTLDALAANPERATALPPNLRVQLILRCAAALAALSGAMVGASDEASVEPMSKPEPDQLLTVPQAAAVMGFASSYVYEMARRGDLRAVRRKKYVRIRQSAVEQWIAEHEDGGVDTKISSMLTASGDRQRNQASPPSSRIEPSRTRRKARSAPDDRQPLGA